MIEKRIIYSRQKILLFVKKEEREGEQEKAEWEEGRGGLDFTKTACARNTLGGPREACPSEWLGEKDWQSEEQV